MALFGWYSSGILHSVGSEVVNDVSEKPVASALGGGTWSILFGKLQELRPVVWTFVRGSARNCGIGVEHGTCRMS